MFKGCIDTGYFTYCFGNFRAALSFEQARKSVLMDGDVLHESLPKFLKKNDAQASTLLTPFGTHAYPVLLTHLPLLYIGNI